ncbi:MAG: Clp protease ClpP [Clostridia bacterium]|nr:Clp protease ClpP [Clostridia bacterium]
MLKFWNFIRNDAGERVLRLEGPIDEESFWGTEITPQAFREELEAEEGDVTVWVNSPGGNVFAAAEIYTMLSDHKGKITVKIDAIAASAASVVAMAGDRVLMSPVAMLMIHDPMTIAMGNAKDMEKAITTLNEVKASIINAYQRKTGLSRAKISQLMENETWMNAKKAVELGFADEVLFADQGKPEETEEEKDDGKEIKVEASLKEWQPYSTRIMGQTILNRLGCTAETPATADEEPVTAGTEEAVCEPTETGLMEQVSMFAEDAPCDESKPKTPGGGSNPAVNPDEDEPDDPDNDPDDDPDDDPNDPDDPDDDPDEDERRKKPANPSAEDTLPKPPMIGMDGKTEDGSMPYELLRKQLEFLK